MKNRQVAFLAMLISLLVLPMYAHHYILVPEKFIYQKGDSMHVRLMVGEPFDFEFERELQQTMTTDFKLYTSMETIDLLRLMSDSSLPVLKTVVNFQGLGLITMQRKASEIELKPGNFQKYLEEEKIMVDFDSLKWKKPVVTEKYSRCIKSLVTAGKAGNENLFSKQVGHRLELLLLTNPYSWKEGDKITVMMLWEGKPLKNMWITASTRLPKEIPTGQKISFQNESATTDRNGIAQFELIPNAVYYLHSVYMRKIKSESGPDFESVWTSYSFQVVNP